MKTSAIILFILVVAIGFLAWQRFFRDDFNLPKGGETREETIIIKDGEVVGTKEGVGEFETKKIMITDGVKHSVPLDEISTLLGKDGIPSIDNPKFEPAKEASNWLGDQEPGIALSLDGVNRFYPYSILTWHEIVNDTINGKKVLITYCPLCLTGFALDPLVKGERVEFGTSGKLWKSNLVMYDRKTDSLWSQVLKEAIVGEMTGTVLSLIPTDQVRYGNWKKLYSNGEVLSRDTGFSRNYSRYPYAGGDYFSVDAISLSFVKDPDTRLPNDAFVFGIVINNKAKAYDVEAVKRAGEVEDTFEGINILLRLDKDLDAVQMFEKLPDGSEERIAPISGFWFSWAAAHPDTELYK